VASFFVLCWAAPVTWAADPAAGNRLMEIEVNARDLSRGLLRSRIAVPAAPGKLRLWYPKWIPGTHGPYGRAEDIGGLRLATAEGKPLAWRRDEVDLHCVECEVPAGSAGVVADLDMICTDTGGDYVGFASYGNPLVGVINWNSCFLYPEGRNCHEQQARVTLMLPEKWQYATALKTASSDDGKVQFAPVSLIDLVDSPLIGGEKLKTFKLDSGNSPPAWLHIASESESALHLDPKVVGMYSKLVREAVAMFGVAHYPEYHFLVTCSDDIGAGGLEHHFSSLNNLRERDLIDDNRRKGWNAYLLPHEYVHSWCGKFRRPTTMCTNDFHTPQRTRLLWVYEGLTQYLGEVLMVRCGLESPEEQQQSLGLTVSGLMRREGRRWRSLEDTAVAAWTLRAPISRWGQLRRSQDFYEEGMLLWLEADAIIRQETRGERSLDDFCKKFLGPLPGDQKVMPYELADLVAAMQDVCKYDWDAFFAARVSRPLEQLPTDVVGRLGYRMQYAAKPPAILTRQGSFGGGLLAARDSLGLSLSSAGGTTTIRDVVPGMPGDKAGLAPGMEIIGVNGKRFSRERLEDALADSVTKKKIDLLLLDQEDFRTVTVEYADGIRYLELARESDKPDLLAEILKPRAK
jgi:predicted metalloprotease with PDZ domain